MRFHCVFIALWVCIVVVQSRLRIVPMPRVFARLNVGLWQMCVATGYSSVTWAYIKRVCTPGWR